MSHTRLPLPLGDTLTLNPLEKEQGPGDRGYSGPFVGGAEGWGACRRPWGGLSFPAEAHEEDGEGAAGGGRGVTGSCCPFRGEACEGRWSLYDISLLQTMLLG